MLTRIKTPPGLLFGAFLYRKDLFSQEFLLQTWQENFGISSIFHPQENPLIPYYEKEMGTPLERFFVVTKQVFGREALLETKLLSLNWESSWAQEQKRRVNVDIGFLSAENFVLATTKNYSHRIYLGEDIFADLTYEFKQGSFIPLPWTYPDYLDQAKRDFLLEERQGLLRTLRAP